MMSSDVDNPDKLLEHVQECRKMGIPLLPVDVNHSKAEFSIETVDIAGRPVKAIRYALTGIKTIGRSVADEIVAHQPYESFEDFVQKVRGRTVHKKVMRTLILAGLFDCFKPNRYALLHKYYFVLRREKPDDVDCPDPATWSDSAKYSLDQESYGFALSGHPAESYPCHYPPAVPYDRPFYISGVITDVIVDKDKQGRQMAKVRLDTPFGLYAIRFYYRQWQRYRSLVNQIRQLDLPLVTIKVRKTRYMSHDIIEAVHVLVPEEAQRMWQEYLDSCFNVHTVLRSSRLVRFYA